MERVARAAGAVWRALGSTWLAAVLLAALLAATALAGLMPQAPGGTGREAWLEAAGARYGGAARWLESLGLFDAARSPWLPALLAALLLSTTICTWQRLMYVRHILSQPQGPAHAGLPAHATSIAAHLAAALLLAAVALRPALARQGDTLTVLPGEQYSDERSGLSLRAGPPIAEFYPGGQIRDVRVPVAVTVDNRDAISDTISLARPLSVSGGRLVLLGYGPAAQVTAPEGTFHAALDGQEPAELTLPTAGLTLRLGLTSGAQPGQGRLFVEAVGGAQPATIGLGTVGDGEQIEVRGVPITLRQAYYTRWQWSRDATAGWAIAAGAMLLVSAGAGLWLPGGRRLQAGSHASALPAAGGEEAAGPPAAEATATPRPGIKADDARWPAGAAAWLAAAVAMAAAGWLAGRGLRAGRWPLGDAYELAWAVVAATALATAVAGPGHRQRPGVRAVQWLALGLLAAVAGYAQLGLPAAQRAAQPLAPALRSAWFPLHAGAAALAYGALLLAGAAAAAWLLRPEGRPGSGWVLDRALAAGYPLLTLSLLLGMVWAHSTWGRYWGWDLKECAALAAWLIYSLYWHLRRRPRWHGRRLAWLALAGLAVVLLNLLGTRWLAGSLSL